MNMSASTDASAIFNSIAGHKNNFTKSGNFVRSTQPGSAFKKTEALNYIPVGYNKSGGDLFRYGALSSQQRNIAESMLDRKLSSGEKTILGGIVSGSRTKVQSNPATGAKWMDSFKTAVRELENIREISKSDMNPSKRGFPKMSSINRAEATTILRTDRASSKPAFESVAVPDRIRRNRIANRTMNSRTPLTMPSGNRYAAPDTNAASTNILLKNKRTVKRGNVRTINSAVKTAANQPLATSTASGATAHIPTPKSNTALMIHPTESNIAKRAAAKSKALVRHGIKSTGRMAIIGGGLAAGSAILGYGALSSSKQNPIGTSIFTGSAMAGGTAAIAYGAKALRGSTMMQGKAMTGNRRVLAQVARATKGNWAKAGIIGAGVALGVGMTRRNFNM